MSTWRYTSRISPVAPSIREPCRHPKPHHSRGRCLAQLGQVLANRRRDEFDEVGTAHREAAVSVGHRSILAGHGPRAG